MIQMNLQNRKRLTDWMPGKGWEDREFGMDRHTHLSKTENQPGPIVYHTGRTLLSVMWM